MKFQHILRIIRQVYDKVIGPLEWFVMSAGKSNLEIAGAKIQT